MVSRSHGISVDNRFIELVRLNPAVVQILARLDALKLQDPWLVSGCLIQTVWNALADERPARAIKDYDVLNRIPTVLG